MSDRYTVTIEEVMGGYDVEVRVTYDPPRGNIHGEGSKNRDPLSWKEALDRSTGTLSWMKRAKRGRR